MTKYEICHGTRNAVQTRCRKFKGLVYIPPHLKCAATLHANCFNVSKLARITNQHNHFFAQSEIQYNKRFKQS